MYKILVSLLLIFLLNTFAIDFGTMLVDKNNPTINVLSKDIQKLLKKYNINLNIKNTKNSLHSISALMNNKSDNYFALVKKDAISFYNTRNVDMGKKSIYTSIPAILSLGSEKIHIFGTNQKEFDFEINKKYKVFCGDINSDSCIASRNIQKIYNFDFKYVQSDKKNVFNDIKNNKVDLYISIQKSPYNNFLSQKYVQLLDLPTNFKMEEIYSHSLFSTEDYSYLNESTHAFASSIVLITNLKDERDEVIIKSLLKVIVLNEVHLNDKSTREWKDVDFENFKYKKFSNLAKKTIIKLLEELMKKNSLIY